MSQRPQIQNNRLKYFELKMLFKKHYNWLDFLKRSDRNHHPLRYTCGYHIRPLIRSGHLSSDHLYLEGIDAI